MNGNCTGHPDPDMWFPEMPPNRPSLGDTISLALQVNEAISLCNTCPSKVECGIEGSKPENLAYGIWGGVLAGERLLSMGHKREDYPTNYVPEGRAIDMFNRLSPWMGNK